MMLTPEQLATGWENRGTLPLIPDSRAMVTRGGNQWVAVLQALVGTRWRSIMVLGSTRTDSFKLTEQLGLVEASELGVPWFNGARIVPALEVVQ